jgi:predicted nucleic acid-binding protein
MTRFAIDASIALQIVRDGVPVGDGHSLVAPNLLRSEAMSALYREVRDGRLDERTGREQLERLAELKIRLLGDRVSRATAWRISAQLGWDDTPAAEYLAVATLQADALISDDPVLRVAAAELDLPLADITALSGGSRPPR